MGKVIAVANQKGGVGKTTTAVNLASSVAAQGKHVLIVDLDPQGNTTSGFGVTKRSVETSVYQLLTGEAPASAGIQHTKYRVDLIASNIQLSGAGLELVNMERRESRLREALTPVLNQYDFIFIDCPPSLDLLTLNGLCACDTVLVPIQCEFFALEGLSELMNTIRNVKKMYNPYIEIEGVLLTMYDGRLNLTLQVVQEVKKYFGNKVYKTTIPRNVRLSEAPSFGAPSITTTARPKVQKHTLILRRNSSKTIRKAVRDAWQKKEASAEVLTSCFRIQARAAAMKASARCVLRK